MLLTLGISDNEKISIILMFGVFMIQFLILLLKFL